MSVFWTVTALVVVLGVPFVLLWWKLGDAWADAENRRFGRSDRPGKAPPADTARVIREDRPGSR